MARRTSLPVLLCLVLSACGQPEPPRPSLTEAPTHERYTAALSEFGLDKTALGQDWLAAAVDALATPVPARLPFSETGYLPADDPSAISYQFDLRRGRRLTIDVTFEAAEPARLFIDLFEVVEGREPRLVASTTPDGRVLDYEARRDAPYLLRVQPELLRGGRYTVTQRSLASLGFPVTGLSLAAVQSVFGDPRDAGRRNHHGIDIFAPRGTPVVAAVDGRVRVDTGNRGGNVIWLTPTDGRRRRLYYAHLHDWAVENGAQVRAGDVIGYVGNTGNARTTPPHLHFGVYDRGPVDPFPFLQPDDGEPPRILGRLELIQRWARVTSGGATLRTGATTGADVRAVLARDLVVRVRAGAGAYYRVTLPDGTAGFIATRELREVDEPIARADAAGDLTLRDRPLPHAAVIDTLRVDEGVDVLGRFGGFHLVRLPDTRTGWIPVTSDAQ
jgi:murein DD-endopeptidase MepM/ murein hydrolase activator NlpD